MQGKDIDKGITPSQTVGPFFKYGLTPNGQYEWNDAFTSSLLTPDVSGERIRGHEIVGEGVIPGVFAARRQPVFEKRTDGLRWRQSFFSSPLHYFVSIGVALRPRSTMLKR